MVLEDACIQSLESQLAQKQKQLYSTDFQKLGKRDTLLFLKELNELKTQLKSLKKQKLKAVKRKAFVAA
ncbi:hypothetical protein [Rufibacter roseus]|uniref:50S ribosomal protein L29 n=1 Tax=Rufibacter roseus TaxID=1567108 RepID=A0ABW2DPX6_9BACT|nr:hypothetical protein [Rufibacter roseus]